MGVGRRSTYKMDNNGKRISKGARLSVPGTRFDGAQVSLSLPFPAPTHPLAQTAYTEANQVAHPSLTHFEHSPTPSPPLFIKDCTA